MGSNAHMLWTIAIIAFQVAGIGGLMLANVHVWRIEARTRRKHRKLQDEIDHQIKALKRDPQTWFDVMADLDEKRRMH